MITNKNSWKYLVMFLIVLVITCGAGGCAMLEGTTGKVFGFLNIALGIFWVIKTYLKARDK